MLEDIHNQDYVRDSDNQYYVRDRDTQDYLGYIEIET